MFDLLETVNPWHVYHSTDELSAVEIINDNCIKGFISHPVTKVIKHKDDFFKIELPRRQKDTVSSDEEYYTGVSLTRSLEFARAWASGYGIVFVLDYDRLRQDKRILQIDYYGNRREAEEFVIGDIRYLKRYFVQILVSQQCVAAIERMSENSGRDFSILLNHPLLSIDGRSWNPLTGKKVD